MNNFQRWMSTATTRQKQRLARLAGTTVATLRQIAGGYRTNGKPKTGPVMARRIERAGREMWLDFPREHLAKACRDCDLLKRCR